MSGLHDLSLIERAVESSPVVVVILIGACIILWRTLREEMREWRIIAAQHSQALHALTVAVDRLREKIEDAR